MASKPVRLRTALQDLPDDFSFAFLKGSSISLKSKRQGYRYYAVNYYHNVSKFIDEEKTIYCSAKCYASYLTNDEPRSVYLDSKPTDISHAKQDKKNYEYIALFGGAVPLVWLSLLIVLVIIVSFRTVLVSVQRDLRATNKHNHPYK